MCSRHLAAAARTADDYLDVYGELLRQADGPVVLHWLGEMFDPALAGYWGTDPVATVLDLIRANQAKVDGIKVSLLDEAFEVDLRRRLPAGTGSTPATTSTTRSSSRATPRATPTRCWASSPRSPHRRRPRCARWTPATSGGYDEIFAPTVPLARHVFGAPTFYYKTGIVFLAWLAGHQSHFTMVGGLQSGRSPQHLATLIRLADAAGVLPDADLAAARARAFMTTAGVTQ